MARRYTALGANIFAGGFTEGVRKHFKILGHLEHDNYGTAIAQLNFPKLPIYEGYLTWPRSFDEPVDFIYSNPPCAVWSPAGTNKGGTWRRDPRLQRVKDIFGLLKAYQPQVWCWESVVQAFVRGRPFVDQLVKEAAGIGYSATFLLIDAQYLNTPQIRKRFFLVFHKIQLRWQVPSFEDPQTVREVLDQVRLNEFQDFDIPHPKHLDKVIRKTKPGGKLKETWGRLNPPDTWVEGPRGNVKGRPGFLHRRLPLDAPAPTVMGRTLIHPTEHRYTYPSELGALSGFPSDWQWREHGKTRADLDLISRGVMPPVGEWLARQVKRSLKKPKKETSGPYLVDFRTPPGSIEDLGSQVPLDLF